MGQQKVAEYIFQNKNASYDAVKRFLVVTARLRLEWS